MKVRDNSIINQKYFNYYFLYVLSQLLITTTSGKSKKIDINILLDTDINIPHMDIQNNIVEFFDINYTNINQFKKQINSIKILKNKFIENIIHKYPYVKLGVLFNWVSKDQKKEYSVVVLSSDPINFKEIKKIFSLKTDLEV